MNDIYKAELSARGVVLGGVAHMVVLPFAAYGATQLAPQLESSPLAILVPIVVLLCTLLLARPVLLLTKWRDAIDPFIGMDGIKAQLQGRVTGLLFGLPIGIFLVHHLVW